VHKFQPQDNKAGVMLRARAAFYLAVALAGVCVYACDVIRAVD
jgi:hypothetical protein